MSRQTTLMRNLATGRVEMARANQPHSHDEGMSDDSGEPDAHEGGRGVTYLTTNMLAPARQPISEIRVDTLDEDQIAAHLDEYYAASSHHTTRFSIFDPKERLAPFKNR